MLALINDGQSILAAQDPFDNSTYIPLDNYSKLAEMARGEYF